MRYTGRAPIAEHIYKNNEITSGTMDAPPAVESTFSSKTHSSVEKTTSDRDLATIEREKMLEAFMQDIKSFIRGIDVNRL